jgi:ABC-type transport system substrate-binding protein
VSNKDFKVYMDSLNARPTKLQFGGVSYGMDFVDPANMLGIWVSTGRHSWKNDQFDKLANEASSMTGDPQKRVAMFQDAEKILVDDVGGIFLFHRWMGNLFQPYVLGDAIRAADRAGTKGLHAGNQWAIGDLYISKDVTNFKTYRAK